VVKSYVWGKELRLGSKGTSRYSLDYLEEVGQTIARSVHSRRYFHLTKNA
jgi:hypothetical protein